MKGFKLGNLFGIELRVNPSWFIVFILVSLLMVSTFGADNAHNNRHWSPILLYTVGVVTSILFFVSVLLHELSHSLVARLFKIRVQTITLHLFGGAAQMEREPSRPREELAIAAAGPLMSILLGFLFAGIWYAYKDVNAVIGLPALQLGIINIGLALFNLIPGFPLDGGRILRGIIWAINKDYRRSTKVAALVGQGVAGLFMMFGLYRVMSGDFQGLWLGLIGFYLLGMAKTSYQQAELQSQLRGLKVGSVLLEDLPSISGRINVAEYLDHYVLGTRNRHYMVVDDNVIRGLVSLQQLQSLGEQERLSRRIEDVMTPIEKLQRIGPETEVIDALELMTQSNTSQLPVVKNNELLGFVGRDSLLNYIRNRFEFGL